MWPDEAPLQAPGMTVQRALTGQKRCFANTHHLQEVLATKTRKAVRLTRESFGREGGINPSEERATTQRAKRNLGLTAYENPVLCIQRTWAYERLISLFEPRAAGTGREKCTADGALSLAHGSFRFNILTCFRCSILTKNYKSQFCTYLNKKSRRPTEKTRSKGFTTLQELLS